MKRFPAIIPLKASIISYHLFLVHKTRIRNQKQIITVEMVDGTDARGKVQIYGED